MVKRHVQTSEKDAISSILDEVESELFGDSSGYQTTLQSLDAKCRSLFPDWEQSLTTYKAANTPQNNISHIELDTIDPDISDEPQEPPDLFACDPISRPSICELGDSQCNDSTCCVDKIREIAPTPADLRRVEKKIANLKLERAAIKKDIAKTKREINESQQRIEQLKAKFRRSEQIRLRMTKALS